MKVAGIIIVLVVLLVFCGYLIWLAKDQIGKVFSKKSPKADLPKVKPDGDNIKVRFVVGKDKVVVFTYNTKDKKLTVKGKETDCFNGVKAIKAADDTVYFSVENTGKLYQLKGEKIIDVFAKVEADDDDDWD